jgi:hypothetical protein
VANCVHACAFGVLFCKQNPQLTARRNNPPVLRREVWGGKYSWVAFDWLATQNQNKAPDSVAPDRSHRPAPPRPNPVFYKMLRDHWLGVPKKHRFALVPTRFSGTLLAEANASGVRAP